MPAPVRSVGRQPLGEAAGIGQRRRYRRVDEAGKREEPALPSRPPRGPSTTRYVRPSYTASAGTTYREPGEGVTCGMPLKSFQEVRGPGRLSDGAWCRVS